MVALLVLVNVTVMHVAKHSAGGIVSHLNIEYAYKCCVFGTAVLLMVCNRTSGRSSVRQQQQQVKHLKLQSLLWMLKKR